MALALKAVEMNKKVCFMSLVQAEDCLLKYCVKPFCNRQNINFEEDRDYWYEFNGEHKTETDSSMEDRLHGYDLICIDEYSQVKPFYIREAAKTFLS